MTSVRAKRNLKVPNRFSSDNSQIETSNANGETIIDYNDNSTSTTHNLVPINRTIKLKPVLREPLKVKLPKLKRPNNLQSSTKDNPLRVNTSEVKIHKVKLPSQSDKKSISSISPSTSSPPSSSSSKISSQHQSSNKIDSKIKSSSSPSNNKINKLESLGNINKNDIADNNGQSTNTSDKKPKSSMTQANNKTTGSVSMLMDTFGSSLLQNKIKTSQNKQTKQIGQSLLEPSSKSSQVTQTKLDVSTDSNPTKNGQLLANASFSSDDTGDGNNSSTRMEIVVSQPDSSNNSGIRCPCGVDDDLGVMVECESCSTWQHGHCINVGTEDDAYEGYICGFCTLPQEKARDSLLQLTVGDKFQSRFKLLESFKKQTSSNPEVANSFYDTVENNSHLNIDDLSQATKELQRVLNSLKIKWRLFANPVYDAELRIWANPYWSADQTGNSEKEENLYYIDRYRGNLKLNIRNMLKKMDKRCQLIDYAISNIESKKNQTDLDRSKRLKESLVTIVQSVKEYKNKMKDLTSSSIEMIKSKMPI